MTKEEIRGQVREERCRLDGDWVRQKSAVIQAVLLEMLENMPVGGVCSYLSAGDEVQTGAIAEECWAGGRPLYVPAFCGKTGRYRFVRFDRDDRLVKGPLDISQPASQRDASPRGVNLVVVPGVAFDRFGGRVGHGGGHYDRLLSELARESTVATRVGLAFEFQVFDRVPMDGADVYMDVVITEKRKIDPKAAERGSTTQDCGRTVARRKGR